MIEEVLQRVYEFGCQNDSAANHRDEMMFNITPATGRFLKLLVEEAKPARIVEIGTSNGYSTTWLAWAAKTIGAELESVDRAADKTAMAAKNLSDAGLSDMAKLHTSAAGEFLNAQPAASIDFLFLDSDRTKYEAWWPAIVESMNWGLIVADNALSHAEAMEPLFKIVAADPSLTSVVLPVGKGQLIVQKQVAE